MKGVIDELSSVSLIFTRPDMECLCQPKEARGILVEPLMLYGLLERKLEVLTNERLIGNAEHGPREAHHDLVLEKRVAELHEHFPTRAWCREMPRAMSGSVAIQVRVPAQQADHIVDPRPAAQRVADSQLGKIDRDLVEMAGMPEIVGPVIGIVHRAVDPSGDPELDGLGVKRIVAAIASGDAVPKRIHMEDGKP